MPIYLHETIEVLVGKMHEYTEGIGNIGLPVFDANKLFCVGIYQTDYSTGQWPELIALWELKDYATFGWLLKHSMEHEGWREWIYTSDKWRETGFDRMLVPTPWSPIPPARPRTERKPGIIFQHTYTINAGSVGAFCEAIREDVMPALKSSPFELELFAQNRSNPTEFFGLYRVDSLDDYIRIQDGRSANVHDETSLLPGSARAWKSLRELNEKILHPTPYSPLGGGADVLPDL